LPLFFDNLTEVDADYFNHQSIYGFYVFRQIDKNTHLYRFEDQMDLFLKDIGFKNELLNINVTRYKNNLSSKSIESVQQKEKKIFEIYNGI